MKTIQYYEARKDSRCLSWGAYVGKMEIAHIWFVRADSIYKVRAYFTAKYGDTDYSKDVNFKTHEEAEQFVLHEWRMYCVRLAKTLGYSKRKP